MLINFSQASVCFIEDGRIFITTKKLKSEDDDDVDGNNVMKKIYVWRCGDGDHCTTLRTLKLD